MEIQFVAADPSFAELFYEHRQDPVTRLYNPLMPSTIEDLRIRLAKASSTWEEFETADSFFWFLKFEKKIIGTASVQGISRTMQTAEIGYGIQPEFRGRGLATQTISSLANQAFTKSPLRKLIAYVHEANLPSRKVLEKIGFKREGLLREHFLVNGLPINEVIYGLLRREFL